MNLTDKMILGKARFLPARVFSRDFVKGLTREPGLTGHLGIYVSILLPAQCETQLGS